MKNKRRNRFILAILAGLVLGLVYGWLVNPSRVRNTTLDSLRSDYQADYVLMVAEKFSVDRDAVDVSDWLNKLCPDDPYVCINQAQIMGQQLGYSQMEMQQLSDLEAGLTSAENAAAEVTP